MALPKAASNAAPRIRSDRSRSVTLLLLRPMRASSRSGIYPPLILMRFEAKRAKYLAIRRASPEESLSATVARICATDKSSQRFYADRTFGNLGQGCLPSLQSSALPAILLISRWPRTRHTNGIC